MDYLPGMGLKFSTFSSIGLGLSLTVPSTEIRVSAGTFTLGLSTRANLFLSAIKKRLPPIVWTLPRALI